ncbi:MAG TPA: glycosyltransferase family 4 protein [Candidatus Polarisedimenticolia bacterium]|jgi:glycosyltransferase involved in cell wall biosynthesis
MRIAYVSAGAAGMLCGSCLHDNTLAAAIRRLGHDIALIPTYTPIRTDEEDVSLGRPFYGALNVYLQTRSSIVRRAPRFVHRILDHPALLRWASKIGSSTSAAELGELTLSVLMGEEGPSRLELERLVSWLRDSFKPEVVHLTNSMFLGLAGPLKRELGVPVICSVQGEDLFLDGLVEPYRERVLDLLRRRAGDADAFIATGEVYAKRMREMLGIPEARMNVVRLGLNLAGQGGASVRRPPEPFVVGYLARVCPEKGLHVLAKGFRELARKAGKERVFLRAAGYLGPKDRPWFTELRARIAEWGLDDRFEYLGEIDRAGKIGFLSGLDVLSVPATYPESKGLSVLEALANGVPVVQPRDGSFPEMIEATGGGVLFEPGSAEGLAAALGSLMEDPSGRRAMGERGREAVHRLFSDEVMARETLKVYFAATCTS